MLLLSCTKDLKMYFCWNATSETQSSKVKQTVDIQKTAEIDNASAAVMMCLS